MTLFSSQGPRKPKLSAYGISRCDKESDQLIANVFNICDGHVSQDGPRGENTEQRTIGPIREVIQKYSVIVARADDGIPVRFLTLDFAIQRSPHMGLEPVHDHLNRLFGLVLEQLE